MGVVGEGALSCCWTSPSLFPVPRDFRSIHDGTLCQKHTKASSGNQKEEDDGVASARREKRSQNSTGTANANWRAAEPSTERVMEPHCDAHSARRRPNQTGSGNDYERAVKS